MQDYLFEQKDNIERAEKMINSVGIPPQPQVIMDLNREVNKPDVNFSLVAGLVGKDPAMSAKVIKIANSPFFSSRKIDSIEEALLFMGIKNFYNLVVTSALRTSMDNFAPGSKKLMERFWDHSLSVAKSAGYIAKKTCRSLADSAYMAGLFHDCAVPLFIKKFPDYSDVMDMALSTNSVESLKGTFKSIIGIEDEKYDTNHCIAGYMMAKSWYLPMPVCSVVCYHHYRNTDIHEDPVVRQLVSVLILAEYVGRNYDASVTAGSDDLKEWVALHKNVLSELDLTGDDVGDIKEDLFEVLCSNDGSHKA